MNYQLLGQVEVIGPIVRFRYFYQPGVPQIRQLLIEYGRWATDRWHMQYEPPGQSPGQGCHINYAQPEVR